MLKLTPEVQLEKADFAAMTWVTDRMKGLSGYLVRNYAFLAQLECVTKWILRTANLQRALRQAWLSTSALSKYNRDLNESVGVTCKVKPQSVNFSRSFLLISTQFLAAR